MARILVIDHDAGDRDPMVAFLRQEGHRVSVPASGRSGLAQALRGGFDVVIAAMFLPDIDGLAILRATKEKQPATRTICLFSFADGVSPAAAMQLRQALGMHALVRKPFAADELRAALADHPAGGAPAARTR